MPDKFSRTPTSRLKVQQKQSLSHNCEENGIKSSISYLDKLPSDMLTNMYKPTKRQQQPATSIHELIFSRLREIDRQYYEETSAQVVKNLRGLVHQSINTSVINGADSNKHLCHDNVIRTHNNISVRSQKTLAPLLFLERQGQGANALSANFLNYLVTTMINLKLLSALVMCLTILIIDQD